MAATRRAFLKSGLVTGTTLALGPRFAHAAGEETAIAPATTSSPGIAADPSSSMTRGIGMYPGAPEAFFGPELVPDTSGGYRNLALRRPAFASSSYDYNLTAQLVTDGLVDTHLPDWIVSVVNGQILPKTERETLVSHEPVLTVELPGSEPTVELHLGGGVELPAVDRLVLFVIVPETVSPSSLRYTAMVSDDGYIWQKAGSATESQPVHREDYPPDLVRGTHVLKPVIPFDRERRSRYYRVEFGVEGTGAKDPYNTTFRLGQIEFHHGDQRVQLGGPYSFTSAWKSAGSAEEWVAVDLGARCSFDSIKLHWIAPAAEGRLQVSDDGQSWRALQDLPNSSGMAQEIRVSGEGRWVRVLMTRPATEYGYILSELEVWGKGGFVAESHAPAAAQDGRLLISGGGWKLQRGPQVAAQGEALSAPGFQDSEWLVATVPGTTLTSYMNLGAIPDPNYGQNQLHISDSYFYADFWYRTEFHTTGARPGESQWLSFEGINWKAEVFLNGAALGKIDGAFTRARFDVTGKLKTNAPNALAILVHKNATPGSCKQKTFEDVGKNGGGLGADNPTFHASVGWDWIPTIRGRNTGIWAEVAIESTAAVTLEDPLVTTKLPLPDVSHADVTVEVFAVNHSAKPFAGKLRGKLGGNEFAEDFRLAPNERKAVRSQFRVNEPKLWWPVGYGEPYLYDAELRLEGRGAGTERLRFKAGLRQMTASEEGDALRLFINGRRFIAKGGNWGFGESMLRFREREYDASVRYHREMNFTMIRNWVGQIGDEAFYDACDRHGVVVWQDFWLANPWDGPIPNDNAMFLANARDYVSRIRNHASVGLYCGRNEWFPPEPLDKGIRQILAELHPDLHYIGSSADGPVSGHGPYRALPTAQYFRLADSKLHSEIGAPAIPTLESVQAMMPEHAVWPQGLDWGLHDFTLIGAQGGGAFRTLVDEAYGGATDAASWIRLGEIVSYEAYRAMFEAQSVHRMGVLLWMSHPCWPSFVWQTYDFYFAPTAAYFACKSGAEPLHVQWNSYKNTVEVVNYSAGQVSGLQVEAEIFDLTGQSLGRQTGELAQCKEDSTSTLFEVKYPSTGRGVQLLRLKLLAGKEVRSENFYLRGTQSGDYTAIRSLPRVKLTTETRQEQHEGSVRLNTTVRNTGQAPALFVRLEAQREGTGDRILPAIYSDGYFALMPGEGRELTTELRVADARGSQPAIVVKGFNVA